MNILETKLKSKEIQTSKVLNLFSSSQSEEPLFTNLQGIAARTIRRDHASLGKWRRNYINYPALRAAVNEAHLFECNPL